jgi:hypothetical protein
MKNFERYEYLLQHKAFDSLSEEERDFVLQFSDEEAYFQAQQLFANLPDLNQAMPQVDSSRLTDLLAKMPTKPSLWLSYRWHFAQAAALLVALCLGWLWGNNSQEKAMAQVVEREKRDTIYLDKTRQVVHYQNIIIYKNKEIFVPYTISAMDSFDIARTLSPSFPHRDVENLDLLDEDVENVVGHSILDEENSLNR